jgi:hypothetical protein
MAGTPNTSAEGEKIVQKQAQGKHSNLVNQRSVLEKILVN